MNVRRYTIIKEETGVHMKKNVHILLDRFRHLSLKYKILTIVLFNSVTMLLCAVFGYRLYTEAYNKLLFDSMASRLSVTSAQISQKMENAEYISNLILGSSSIQDCLSDLPSPGNASVLTEYNRTINNALTEYATLFRSNGIAYAAVYSKNGEYVNCTNWVTLKRTPGFLLDAAIQNGYEKEGAVTWTHATRQPYMLLSSNVRQIRNMSLESLGNMVIGLDLEQVVSEAVRFASQYKDQKVVIANQSGSLIYVSTSLTDQRAKELITDPFTTYKIISYDDHKYFAVKGTLPHYQYSYVTLAPFDEVAGALTVSMQATLMIFLIGILFIWYLSSRLIQGIICQFDALIQKMKLFTQNELELEPEEEDYGSQPSEIGALHHQFHQMALRIQNLVKVNYINEILAKDAQLKALRSQISPHFLYNTLETINWRAKAMGNEVISQMVESLGNLLRVSLSSQKTLVTLAYELELVDSYITIQKIRFEERLEFKVITDENAKEGMIPPLTIQPLVENAIHYGMEEMTDVCHIYLQAEVKEGVLTIQARNEGSNFEEELLEKLRNKSRSPHGFGIGLLNIDQRIRLLFGEEYGLALSNEHDFAVATIKMPFQKEEEIC